MAPSSPSSASGSASPAVVTPAELCALDGRAWQDTVFTFVTNSPDWGDTTPACDEARVAAYWDVLEKVQPAITSIDLASGDADDQRSIGFVGVAVIPRAAASSLPAPTDSAAAPDTGDPATAVALIDAEVAACLDGSVQSALEHGSWSGVRGPFSGDSGELLTWWTAGADSWAFVQAYISDTIPQADAAEFELALSTVLDAQAERIGA